MKYSEIPANQRMLKWEGKVYCGTAISLLGFVIIIIVWIWVDIYAILEILQIGFANTFFEVCVFIALNCILFLITRYLYISCAYLFARYDICPEGLVIAFPFHKAHLYDWRVFVNTDICDVYLEREYVQIIRCFIKENVKIKKIHMIESYFGTQNQVIVLAFSPERLKQLGQYIPEIQDHRSDNKNH